MASLQLSAAQPVTVVPNHQVPDQVLTPGIEALKQRQMLNAQQQQQGLLQPGNVMKKPKPSVSPLLKKVRNYILTLQKVAI